MRQLNQMWQLVNAAGAVREIAQQNKTYHFGAPQPTTFYLRTESAVVQVIRWARPVVEVSTRLQAAFGWRILTEQDDAGIYIAAKRRIIVGTLSTALFEVRVPYSAYVVLKLTDCDLNLTNVNDEIHLPAYRDDAAAPLRLSSGYED